MKYRYVLAVILLLGLGCADEKGQWDEFLKDLRGDNMKMRSDAWGKAETGDSPLPTSSRE